LVYGVVIRWNSWSFDTQMGEGEGGQQDGNSHINCSFMQTPHVLFDLDYRLILSMIRLRLHQRGTTFWPMLLFSLSLSLTLSSPPSRAGGPALVTGWVVVGSISVKLVSLWLSPCFERRHLRLSLRSSEILPSLGCTMIGLNPPLLPCCIKIPAVGRVARMRSGFSLPGRLARKPGISPSSTPRLHLRSLP